MTDTTDSDKQAEFAALLAKMAERGAERFFADHGLPEELMDGWRRYQLRCNERIKVGYPMPPGGCIVLGRESVWAGCLAEFHTGLANLLQIKPEKIKLKIDNAGSLPRVVAEVEMSELPAVKLAGDPALQDADREKILGQYLAQSVELLNQVFRANLGERLGACEVRREDLIQEVARVSPEEAN